MSIKKKVYLAEPRGFCAGVIRALQTVEDALEKYGSPLYVFHEIVHNDYIIAELKKKGVIFIEDLEDVPSGSHLVFSAHGVSKELEKAAEKRQLQVIDATCPLVKKNHQKAEKWEAEGKTIILIGHKKHPETIGTLGQLSKPAIIIEDSDDARTLSVTENKNKNFAYLTQTTLSLDDTEEIIKILKGKLPGLQDCGVGDICYATGERQKAVKKLAKKCDLILVIGSPKSSNSNRLREVAEKCGTRSLLINQVSELNLDSFDNLHAIGISAGASAPECLVEELLEKLKEKGWKLVV
jgi:4-hydroxy-3-methylbut-2-enyl diphosphate reductase